MRHWISCNAFTVEVSVDGRGVITRAAPIVRRFIGQPLGNLLRWTAQRGGLRHEKYDGSSPT